jgi:hypothetical protein
MGRAVEPILEDAGDAVDMASAVIIGMTVTLHRTRYVALAAEATVVTRHALQATRSRRVPLAAVKKKICLWTIVMQTTSVG